MWERGLLAIRSAHAATGSTSGLPLRTLAYCCGSSSTNYLLEKIMDRDRTQHPSLRPSGRLPLPKVASPTFTEDEGRIDGSCRTGARLARSRRGRFWVVVL